MDEQQTEQLIDRFPAEALAILTPPRAAVIGHETDAGGLALSQHVMLTLRIDGDIRAGMGTAFLWFVEKNLGDEMGEARMRPHDALLGRAAL